MAHGLPDWYRGVDIAYQALAQLITRPTYGGAIQTEGNKVVTASATTILATVSGTGMIYGGFIRLDEIATQQASKCRLDLDGQLVANDSFEDLSAYSMNIAHTYPLLLTMFDNAAFKYCQAISYGLTFETEIELLYTEAHGRTPTVYYSIVYALL